MKRKKLEIAGAGLAGLCLAIRMAQYDWEVTVHEKNSELRMFGAGIWLWENGLKVLESVGALENAVKNAQIIDNWRILNRYGDILFDREFDEADRLLLPPRADLYESLIHEAKNLDVKFELNSEVVGATPSGELILSTGERRRADLVVGADGIGSKVRDSLNLLAWADYGDQVGIRFLTDHLTGMDKNVIAEYWSNSWRVLYNPCTAESDYIFLSAPISDGDAVKLPLRKNLWKDRFPKMKKLIDSINNEDGRWDRIGNVRCRKWSAGKVAIVGDAAHSMPPNLGQAANMAFTNVMALAEIVSKASEVTEGLIEWESYARPLTNHVQWWSYTYDKILDRWPKRFEKLRDDLIKTCSKSTMFLDGLNKGARSIPLGYRN